MQNEWTDNYTDEELFLMVSKLLLYLQNKHNVNKDKNKENINNNNELFNCIRK